MKAASPEAAVHPDILKDWGLKPRSQLLVENDGKAIVVWLHVNDEVPKEHKGKPVIWLTKRARMPLGIGDKGTTTVRAILPEAVTLPAAVALVDDLPNSHEVDVSLSIKRRIARNRNWALLILDEVPMPVRLRARDISSDKIRVSFPTRALIYPSEKPDSEILQLSSFLTDKIPLLDRLRRRHPPGGFLRLCWELIKLLIHNIGYWFELFLRPILRSPIVALTTSDALVGEDTYRVVRLNAQIFPLLGIVPGEQVIINWASNRVVATALELPPNCVEQPELLSSIQRTDLHRTGSRNSVAPQLTVKLTAPMRANLGVPRYTVVTVRRRLTPIVLARLNQLTIPIGGLLLAALAIPNLSSRTIWASVIAVIALALISARYRMPPHGRWP
jgi:hypothetical protein